MYRIVRESPNVAKPRLCMCFLVAQNELRYEGIYNCRDVVVGRRGKRGRRGRRAGACRRGCACAARALRHAADPGPERIHLRGSQHQHVQRELWITRAHARDLPTRTDSWTWREPCAVFKYTLLRRRRRCVSLDLHNILFISCAKWYPVYKSACRGWCIKIYFWYFEYENNYDGFREQLLI